jgi:hypothetical protein
MAIQSVFLIEAYIDSALISVASGSFAPIRATSDSDLIEVACYNALIKAIDNSVLIRANGSVNLIRASDKVILVKAA